MLILSSIQHSEAHVKHKNILTLSLAYVLGIIYNDCIIVMTRAYKIYFVMCCRWLYHLWLKLFRWVSRNYWFAETSRILMKEYVANYSKLSICWWVKITPVVSHVAEKKISSKTIMKYDHDIHHTALNSSYTIILPS